MTEEEIKDLETAGAQYVGDWLSWHEAAPPSNPDGELQGAAWDMGEGYDDPEIAREYIYEGMLKELKKRGRPL